MGILDHRIFAKKMKTNFTTQKFYNVKFSRLTVCMCVCTTWKGLCMSYLEDGMYVCTCVLRGGLYVYVYVHSTWWLCVCTHIYVHTIQVQPSGRTHT